MKYFSFREYAAGSLNRRGEYKASRDVMELAFRKENRFQELWVGMYMFKTAAPIEGDAAFGNFNLEIDDENFLSLRLKMLAITDYLTLHYQIKSEHMDFQLTNRSLWVSIPSKVFACYGKANLHLIHKKMAEEIQQHLLSNGFNAGIDLSIYRWNGLMRGLGSYLAASRRRVTKFALSDLEEAFSFDQLAKAKFDTGGSFSQIPEIPAAIQWFKQAEKRVNNDRKQQSVVSETTRTHAGMESFLQNGILPFNRNLHIYSLALYLKGKGLSATDAIQKIGQSFRDGYVKSREGIRTIQSAFKGNKRFSPKAAQGYLDDEIFQHNDNYTETKTTFIVPRKFIEVLHSQKAHYRSYKLLFQILFTYQVHKQAFSLSLKGDKYKKTTLGYFELLKSAGFIRYAVENDTVTANISHQPREVYQSHIVVPVSFMQRPVFKKLKREFILLVELWKSGLKVSESKAHYFVNIKMSTLQKRLRMTLRTLHRYLSLLKKERLYFNRKLYPEAGEQAYKSEMSRRVEKALEVRKGFLRTNYRGERSICENAPESLYFQKAEPIMKCNYSRGFPFRPNPLSPILSWAIRSLIFPETNTY